MLYRTCPLCNSRPAKIYHKKYACVLGINHEHHKDVSLCKKCGFLYDFKLCNNEELNEYYTKMSLYEYPENYGNVPKDYEGLLERGYEFVENFKTHPFKTVLDVGAANGCGLSVYKKKGYEVYGIEPSPKCAQIAKDFYGIEIFTGVLANYSSDRQYDLITLSHTLEHIVDINYFFENIDSLVHSNSHLFIEVPNASNIKADGFFSFFSFEHVQYFTAFSLEALLNKYGWRKTQIIESFNRNGSILLGLFKKSSKERCFGKLNPYNYIFTHAIITEYIKQSKSEKARIDNKVSYIIKNSTNICIYAAGTHTSELLTNYPELLDRTKFIVDTDSKKHGLKFFALDVVDPRTDRIKEIDSILISSQASEKQIFKRLEADEKFVDKQIFAIYSD